MVMSIRKKVVLFAVGAAVMMAAICVFVCVCIDKIESHLNSGTVAAASDIDALAFLPVVTIVVTAVFVVVLLIIAILFGRSIVTPVNMLTKFIKVVAYNGQVVFSEENWVIARKMAKAKDETGIAFAALNDMVLRFEKIGQILEKVAQGDFTVEAKSLGEADLIGNSIIKVLSDLNRVLEDINSITVEVRGGADQISGISQSLAQGSSEQATAVEQLSASIEEISNKTMESTNLARDAANLSQNVMGVVQKGNEQMKRLITAVEDINTASQNISKIIRVINDIAFQTNILALNAAVEAARAGSAGKGFAVVADEVRNLASKSADAAKETGALIENSMRKAELGMDMAGQTAASLSEVVSGIEKSARFISEIASSSEEQNNAITQINIGISQVSDVVQRTSATSQEAAASAEELDSQSSVLQEHVAQFKLKAARPGATGFAK
jgi:methyl-accepting chemotaxis protein